MMRRERFEALADAYGARLERWPAETRADARAYLAAHPNALDEAAGLDVLLSASVAPAPSAHLAQKILFQAPRRGGPVTRAMTWMSGAGLAAACLLGVVAGATLPATLFNETGVEEVGQTVTAFDTPVDFAGLEEMG